MKFLKIYRFQNSANKITHDFGKTYTLAKEEKYTQLPTEIVNFFDAHSKNVINSNRAQNVRFKDPHVEFLKYLTDIFDTSDKFSSHCDELTKKFNRSLRKGAQKNFYLIFYASNVDNLECLSIFVMEAHQGVQVDKEEFNILDELLPDIESRLKKAAIIFREASCLFCNGKETNEVEKETNGQDESVSTIKRHAVLIDSISSKGDVAIAEYFLNNFLDCEIMADNPTAVANVLKKVIPKAVNPYLNDNYTKKDIINKLKIKFSNETRSSFDSVAEEISSLLSEEKLKKDNLDILSLGDMLFDKAKEENDTITKSFTAKMGKPPKTVIKDKNDGKSINISISQKSIENMDSYINSDDDFYIIKVRKDIVDLKKQQ